MCGWRIGDGILTEVAQAGEGLFSGFADGVDAPLERGEDSVIDGGGLAEGVIRIGVEAVLVGVGVEFGLGAAEAEEGPLAADDLVDVDAHLGESGAEAVVVRGDESVVGGTVLAGEDRGLGVDAGFKGVEAGGCLTLGGLGACGFLSVSTIGVDLAEGCHG